MPYFNRFDICEAHSLLEEHFNKDGIVIERPSNRRRNESTGCQLERMQFSPSMSLSFESMDENGQDIYLINILKWKLPMDEEILQLMEKNWVPEWLVEMRPDVWGLNKLTQLAYRLEA